MHQITFQILGTVQRQKKNKSVWVGSPTLRRLFLFSDPTFYYWPVCSFVTHFFLFPTHLLNFFFVFFRVTRLYICELTHLRLKPFPFNLSARINLTRFLFIVSRLFFNSDPFFVFIFKGIMFIFNCIFKMWNFWDKKKIPHSQPNLFFSESCPIKQEVLTFWWWPILCSSNLGPRIWTHFRWANRSRKPSKDTYP